MTYPVYVLTNDHHLWLLKGFCYLFQKYWPYQPVTIFGYHPPQFALPDGFSFKSLGPTNRPYQRWSDGLIEMIKKIESETFILMLEDYWLTKEVNYSGLLYLYGDMLSAKIDWLRLDLSGERAS